MMKYPKIEAVKPLDNMRLFVTFEDKTEKIYDCSKLINQEPFDKLENEFFFRMVQVDQGGYGVIWSEDIDLAESELWINGY